jgi:hypothetical protein
VEKAMTLSLPLIALSPLTIPIFSHNNHFQLNRSSVGHAGRPPSVNKGIKGWLLPYLPATRLQKVTAVRFPLLFIFSPTIPIFSQVESEIMFESGEIMV